MNRSATSTLSAIFDRNKRMNEFNVKDMFKPSASSVSHTLTIKANKNNTLINLAKNNNLIMTTTGGNCKLKGSHRGTSDAGALTAGLLVKRVTDLGLVISNLHVRLDGFGPGRDQAFRVIRSAGWSITRLSDVSPIRFGGCRPKKKRRL